MKVVSVPYEPRPAFMPFHTRSARWACLVCHRRAGKTVATINDIVSRALYFQGERGRYGYIAPFYSQAKQIAWDYLKHYTKEVREGNPSESGLYVNLVNDTRITLYGADNPDSFRGLYFDGAAIDEYGNCKPNLWSEILRPALSDRKGWATFIGTPNGPNHFYDVWEKAGISPDWFRFLLKASESNIIDPQELSAMKQEMTADEYESEMECSWFAAVRGSIFGQEMKAARIGNFPTSPHVPCNYVFDLGITDTTAIWRWQEYPDHLLVSLAVEWDSRPAQFYIDWLHAQRTSGLKMGTVWLPHDAKAKTWQTGRSAVEQFISQGIRPRIVPSLSVQDGIQAARMMFKQCVFDEQGCEAGLKALKSYKRKWDVEKKAFLDKPDHDWASNFADSFRYLALVAKLAPEQQQSAEIIALPTPLYPFTMDQAWECGPTKHNRL